MILKDQNSLRKMAILRTSVDPNFILSMYTARMHIYVL